MESRDTRFTYHKNEIDDLFRKQLSEITYAWGFLYPEPMSSFSRIISLYSKEEVDKIFSFLQTILLDSHNNISAVRFLMLKAISDVRENLFEISELKQEFEKLAAYSRVIETSKYVKSVQNAIANVFTESVPEDLQMAHDLTFAQLELLREKLAFSWKKIFKTAPSSAEINALKASVLQKTKLLEEIKVLQKCEQQEYSLYKLLKGEHDYVMKLAQERRVCGNYFLAALDKIIRNSKFYTKGDYVENLRNEFAKANQDLEKMLRLVNQVEVRCKFYPMIEKNSKRREILKPLSLYAVRGWEYVESECKKQLITKAPLEMLNSKPYMGIIPKVVLKEASIKPKVEKSKHFSIWKPACPNKNLKPSMLVLSLAKK